MQGKTNTWAHVTKLQNIQSWAKSTEKSSIADKDKNSIRTKFSTQSEKTIMHRERNKEHFSILKADKSCYKKVNSRRNWGRRENEMRKHRQRGLKQCKMHH